jgi:hypothetical protein
MYYIVAMAEVVADFEACRWDSSDPERAPPPLPMNPSSPLTSTSRPNTSSAIQSAHAALTEKARESGYITNPPLRRIESPERSLIKGAAHKRMQSLHTGSVRDLSSFLEGGSSFAPAFGPSFGPVKLPEKTYGRPSTPHTNKDFVLESRSPEKDSRFLLESKSPEKDSRFLLESKSPDKDSRFLLESKSLEKESRYSFDSRPDRDTRFLSEDRSLEKQTRFANENRSPERDSRFLLEGTSPERESRFVLPKNPEKDSNRSSTPTPGREPPSRDIPVLRPSLRRPPQSILSENIPPQSATMLALQNMATRDIDAPLSNVTNGSTALVRTPQTFDAISNQILSLTSIATSLQREMAQLSRRSKDNATDLVSLKEATNARDEDIRKSLRELVNNLSESRSRTTSNLHSSGGLYLDNKAHNSPGSSSRNLKGFSLPRIPSPNSFAASLDRESVMISPGASYCHDGVTNIALLEKILREMSTREGLEHLGGRIGDLLDLVARDGSATARKLDELLQLLKDHHSNALVAHSGRGNGGGAGNTRNRNLSFSEPPVLELDFDQSKSGSAAQQSRALISTNENAKPSGDHAAEIINEDVVKLIRTIKDSVAQGGGLTAEVKALVRELRGEVLGMGREIGRKLDQGSTTSAKDATDEKERVTRVVQDGLEDLKQHMDNILREHRRQSAASIASVKPIDYQEIYNAVRSAVNEKQQRSPELQKEEIVQAVREAWEAYKPDIKVEQYGLEREELLTCLKEGIQEYCPKETAPSATRDEVFTAVVEGLKHFVPPQVESPASLSRDEILDAVRECLEEFEFPSAPPVEPLESGLTRDDMLDAVKEGLHTFDFAGTTTALSRETGESLTRDDMLDAVKEGLHTFDFAGTATALSREVGESLTRDDMLDAVKEGLHTFDFPINPASESRDIPEGMSREEMVEAVKEGLRTFDFAAHTTALTRVGTENEGLTRDDMLDAVREGLHTFDFPMNPAPEYREIPIPVGMSKDEMVEAVKEGLQTFDIAAHTTALTRAVPENDGLTRDDMLDAVREGLHTFDFPINNTSVERDIGQDLTKADVLDAMNECLHNFEFPATTTALSRDVGESLTRGDMLNAVKEGLHTFDFAPTTSTALIHNAGVTMTKDDVYDAVKAGLDDIPQMDTFGGQILEKLQEVMECMRTEFRAVSEEAKENVSAHGRDTEQVLDATKDGFEKLRSDIETYVDRAVDINGKDELLDRVRESFDSLRTEVELLSAQGSTTSLAAVQSELEHLRETIATSLVVRGSSSADKDEIIEALRTGLESISLETVQSELEQLRGTMSTSLVASNNSGTDKEEIIEALRTGLESFSLEAVQNELEQLRETMASSGTDKDEIIEALRTGLENVSLEAVQNELEQLRETLTTSLVVRDSSADKDEIIEVLKTGLENVSLEAVQNELEQLRETLTTSLVVRSSSSTDKDEIIEVLKTGLEGVSLEAVQNELEQLRETLTTSLVVRDSSADKDEIIKVLKAGLENVSFEAVHNELEQLRETLTTSVVVKSSSGADKDEIIEALKTGLESVSLEAVQNELEQLRETLTTSLVVRSSSSTDKDEIIEVLKTGLEGVSLEAVQNELEQLRETMATSLVVRSSSGADKDEIIEVLRTGLESIRMEVDRPRDGSESVLSGTGEILDAVNDGINSLRVDLEKIVNKPVDMTISYEILDTLKLGLEGVRADIDKLRENGHGEQAVAEINDNAIVPLADSLKRNDIEHLEVLIQQLRTKVEALDFITPPPPPSPPQTAADSLSKSDLETVEELLRNLQESIASISTQERSVDEDGVKRDDVISIETLLRNTKAKIDEFDPEQTAKKEHLETVELLIAETKAGINDLTTHLEDVSKRDDVVIVEGLVRDLMHSLEEMKERAADESRDADKATKADVEAAEAVCLEVKAAIEQMILSDISVLATKEDVKNLEGLVKEFKGRVESQELVTMKELEDRQAETVGVGEQVTEIKSFLEEFRDALKEKLDDGASTVNSLGKILENLGETINQNATVTSDDIRDMLETVKSEFEKSNAGVVGSKLESDEKFQQTWDNLGRLVHDFEAKIDEKFDELMTKYDDAQLAAETKATMEDEKKGVIEAALLGTKAVAEDVKIIIDTLGTTLTESVEKMDEAGKTVFNRVEDTFTRVDDTFTLVEETHADAKAEHQLTREQVLKALGGVEGVQSYLTEYNPQILESLKDVLLVVGQHYEHSKTSAVALQEKISEIPPPPELPLIQDPPEKYDDTAVHEKLDKLVGNMHDDTPIHDKLDRLVDNIHDDTPIHEKLDRLVENMHDDTPVHEKLDRLVDNIHDDAPVHEKLDKLVDNIHDDTPVHEKLDKLVDHMHAAGKSFAQLDMLDKIHRQVMQTAAEVSEFVSIQTKRITDEHEDREKAVEVATIALEKQIAQKENVEATVVGLREEEERLKASVAALKAEQDDLAHQKMRLSADVSSLETALKIRREELHAMESRAEGLERRILEGVIDHSRALLLSKSNKGRDAMSRKRVPSHAPSATGSIISNAASRVSTTHSAVSMAMSNRALAAAPLSNPAGASRRILSLNQITNNVPAGNFKRSHSVKTSTGAGALRKSSWGGSLSRRYGDLNKENLSLKESDDDVSESGTMRRSSRGTTIMTGTGTGLGESVLDEGTEWTGSSISDDEHSDDEDEHHEPDGEPEPEPSQMVLYHDGGQVA